MKSTEWVCLRVGVLVEILPVWSPNWWNRDDAARGCFMSSSRLKTDSVRVFCAADAGPGGGESVESETCSESSLGDRLALGWCARLAPATRPAGQLSSGRRRALRAALRLTQTGSSSRALGRRAASSLGWRAASRKCKGAQATSSGAVCECAHSDCCWRRRRAVRRERSRPSTGRAQSAVGSSRRGLAAGSRRQLAARNGAERLASFGPQENPVARPGLEAAPHWARLPERVA